MRTLQKHVRTSSKSAAIRSDVLARRQLEREEVKHLKFLADALRAIFPDLSPEALEKMLDSIVNRAQDGVRQIPSN